MPHGVDFELFRDASLCPQVPEELKTVPRPVIGYYGTLSSSNDVELWTYCARQLKTFSFVFAGQVTGGDYSELSSMPNVHFLGKLPYEKIPILCSCFDVCMLQWRMTEWIAACNPLKTMEYMASGKPIVSVPIQYIVDNYNELISIAQNKEEFCAAIQWELQNDTPDRSARRIEIAGQHSWESHYRIIKHWIDELLEEKK